MWRTHEVQALLGCRRAYQLRLIAAPMTWQATLTFDIEVLDVKDSTPIRNVCIGILQIIFLMIVFRFIHVVGWVFFKMFGFF